MSKILFISLSTERLYNNPQTRPMLEPLWAEYLAAMVPEHDIKILDMNVDLNLIKVLKEFNPDFLGVSITTPLVKEANEVIKLTREFCPSARIIIGGPHVSALKGKDLDYDIAVLGEGETLIKKIIENDVKSGSVLYESPIENLDEIPFPKRVSRGPYNLKYDFENQILASVMTSRSCPYQCIYCSSKSIFGRKLRLRSPENVIKELEELKNDYGVNSVIFLDDCFTFDRERVKKICSLMIKKDLGIKWWIDTRCDHVDKELLRLMKKAGCKHICYGVEAGSQEVLDRIKKNITVDKIKKAFKITKEVGINVECNIMIGHLDETEEEIWQSIRLAKELEANKSNFFKVIPLPGSELYDIAIKRRLIEEHPNFENFAWYKNPPSISKVSQEKLEELQKIAYKEVAK